MTSLPSLTTRPATAATATVELFWIPVGAGTPRLQQASLRLWEAFEAARARRPRTQLLHAAVKLHTAAAGTLTVELVPAFVRGEVPPAMTGPVGVRALGRVRLFRYELKCLPLDALPDEAFAVGAPVPLSVDDSTVQKILDLAPQVPPHIWGRRAPGTREMWTSDSAISWLLTRAGIDLTVVRPPAGGRAPGWDAGLEAARGE